MNHLACLKETKDKSWQRNDVPMQSQPLTSLAFSVSFVLWHSFIELCQGGVKLVYSCSIPAPIAYIQSCSCFAADVQHAQIWSVHSRRFWVKEKFQKENNQDQIHISIYSTYFKKITYIYIYNWDQCVFFDVAFWTQVQTNVWWTFAATLACLPKIWAVWRSMSQYNSIQTLIWTTKYCLEFRAHIIVHLWKPWWQNMFTKLTLNYLIQIVQESICKTWPQIHAFIRLFVHFDFTDPEGVLVQLKYVLAHFLFALLPGTSGWILALGRAAVNAPKCIVYPLVN